MKNKVALILISIAFLAYQNCSGAFKVVPPPQNQSQQIGDGGDPTSNLAITQGPQSTSAVKGQSATFTVNYEGALASEVSFQWSKNGSPLDGATGATLTINSLKLEDHLSQIQVRLSSKTKSITSSPAIIQVFEEHNLSLPVEHIVDLKTVDPQIDSTFGINYSEFQPLVATRGELFVFFPASGSIPSNDLKIIRSAAQNGYHSIGLAYPNKDVVALLCNRSTDIECQRNIREETFSGQNVSNQVTVDTSNSVENRIAAILKFLRSQYPQEGWGSYLNSQGQVQWNLLRLSGHSQGGGLAAYIAKKRAVSRVCTFSSPADFNNDLSAPATWVFDQSLTDSIRFFGFGHVNDPIVPWPNLQKIFSALGTDQYGLPSNVDSNPNGLNGTHLLSTSYGGNGPSGHSIPVVDSATPLDTYGAPLFLNVWQYLCFRSQL